MEEDHRDLNKIAGAGIFRKEKERTGENKKFFTNARPYCTWPYT
jgi:hypothetical protein